MNSAQEQPTWLDLYDYRNRVAAMYNERAEALRAGQDEQLVLQTFRAHKDALFEQHAQSALDAEQKSRFTGLRYFPHNPLLRVDARLEPIHPGEVNSSPATMSGDHSGDIHLRPAATAYFSIGEQELHLTVFWIEVYGGGLFLPFRDSTSGHETYGGGRYLFDTVKGSDFLRPDDSSADLLSEPMSGYAGGRIILDFNYAYNPSCAYNVQWSCPLAPRENWLKVAINAGEQTPEQ